MRMTFRSLSLAMVVALVAFAPGCAKKSPAPPPAPPVQPPAPPAPPKVEQPEPPKVEQPAAPKATVGDLKMVFFALDSYTFDDAARAALDADAKLLRDQADLAVRIEGHCDERGTVEYNMSLGEKRADAVRDYLVNAGVTATRLSTISYGKERPLSDGHDESAWSKNRRAEFSKP